MSAFEEDRDLYGTPLLRPTPPLDPSKVKAGDTVTVRHLGAPNTPMRPFEVTGEVYDWGGPHVGGLDLSDPYVTLTDHQPAPEPEPEWKPGTVALLSLLNDDLVPRAYRTSIGTWHSIDDNRSWSDEDVNYVHEVVVINPADVDVDALLRAYAKGYTEGLSVEPRRDGLRAALAQLGIEVQS